MNLETISNTVVGNSSFTITDYIVVGFMLAVVLFCGMYHGLFYPANREDFLIGGRLMRPTPIAVSTAMLYMSALAVIENPAEIYYHGIQPFMISVVTVAIVPVSALLFVAMFHNMQLTSVYQYVGHRFDSGVFRCITSLAFIVHQTYYVCAMLGELSSALERYFHVPVMTSIIGIGAFTAASTTLGGFKATVWTQVFNFLWTTLFLSVLVIVSASKAGGFMQAFELAAENGRLDWNLQVNPFSQHNLFNFLIGYGFIAMMDISTNQHIVQRYSSVDTLRDATKSIIMGVPLYIVPNLLCLLIGIFLQATYAGCDPITLHHIDKPQDIIPHFARKYLLYIPGMVGFFTATLVGSAISVYSTVVSAVTACAHKDLISKLGCCKSKSKTEDSEESESAACCRFISFSYAVGCCFLTLLFTVKLSDLKGILTLPVASSSNFLLFNSVLYGPLAAVFLMGMFCPCANKYGASVGFIGGLLCTGYIAVNKMLSLTTPIDTLLPIMGSCPDSLGFNGTVLRFLPWHPKDDELVADAFKMDGPIRDVFYISYLLLTLLGSIITIIISFPISILTGGLCLCASRKVPACLLHPALSFCSCCVDSEKKHLRQAISHRYVDRIASVHNIFQGNGTRLSTKPPSYKYRSLTNSPVPTA